jgi:hypothetical protein
MKTIKTTKAIFLLSFLIFLFITINGKHILPAGLPNQNKSVKPVINKSLIEKHIKFLGSDLLEGRGTGTNGEKLAAKYIAGNLKEYSITPAGNDGNYFQHIPMHGSMPLPSSELNLFNDFNEYKFKLFKDYFLYKSGAQTFIPNPVPMVFVGYGIIAPEYDYNDYQGIDVKGKIVVFLSGEPQSDAAHYFAGKAPTIFSYPESKQRIAIGQGAVGSILIPYPFDGVEKTWAHYQKEFSFEDVTLAYRVTGHLSILLSPAHADKLFKGSKYSFTEVMTMTREHAVHSFDLGAELSFKGHFRERDFISPNVAGVIEGSDLNLKNTYILISAHYDHLGIGACVKGDSIYNGVVDNAIGTAAVLELARLFSEAEIKPKRSVIFLFVTGEEKGLLGSKYYVDHPLVPLNKTIANVNVDGLAIFDTFNNIVGVGCELSTLGEILEAVALLNGLHVSAVPPQFLNYESFARSDQMAFAQGGIPSILIMDGLNYKHLTPAEGLHHWIHWNDHIYHSPFDDLRQEINFEAVYQHTKFLFDFCYRLSNMEQQPQWKEGVPFLNKRLQTIAENR